MATQYQVLLVIEAVDLDEAGEVVPDSREEIHCEAVKFVSSEDAAYTVVNGMIDAKDAIERIYPWLCSE